MTLSKQNYEIEKLSYVSQSDIVLFGNNPSFRQCEKKNCPKGLVFTMKIKNSILQHASGLYPKGHQFQLPSNQKVNVTSIFTQNWETIHITKNNRGNSIKICEMNEWMKERNCLDPGLSSNCLKVSVLFLIRWMNEWMNEWMNGWMDWWFNGGLVGWVND